MKPSVESLLKLTEFELQKVNAELEVAEETVREDLIRLYAQYTPTIVSQEEFVRKNFNALFITRKAELNSAKRELLQAREYYELYVK